MAKIKFVREYKQYSPTELFYDVLYESNKLFMYTSNSLPKTVRTFIENASVRTVQYDKIFKRDETIYKEK